MSNTYAKGFVHITPSRQTVVKIVAVLAALAAIAIIAVQLLVNSGGEHRAQEPARPLNTVSVGATAGSNPVVPCGATRLVHAC